MERKNGSLVQKSVQKNRGSTGKGVGTGFMVAPGIVLTNNHVLKDAVREYRAEFFADQEISLIRRLRSEHLFCGSLAPPEQGAIEKGCLDYTLVAIDDLSTTHPTMFRESVVLSNEFKVGQPVIIVGYPKGERQVKDLTGKITKISNFNFLHSAEKVCGGSSGSPIFDDKGYLLGLHRAGDSEKEGCGEGIIFKKIIKDCKNDGHQFVIDDYLAKQGQRMALIHWWRPSQEAKYQGGDNLIFENVFDPDWIPKPPLKHMISKEKNEKDVIASITRSKNEREYTVCHGKRGTGKTLLVLSVLDSDKIRKKYCKRRYWLTDTYHKVWLDKQCIALAQKLGIFGNDWLSVDRAISWFIEYLEENSFLIIFDNAGSPDTLMRYIPQKTSHVLITTPRSDWKSGIEVTFSRDETCELVKTIVGEREYSSINKSDIANFVEKMDFSPFAIKQAFAFILPKDQSIKDFLTWFEGHSFSFIEDEHVLNDEERNLNKMKVLSKTKKKSILNLWDADIDSLRNISGEDSIQLLNEMAYFFHDNIPCSIGKENFVNSISNHGLITKNEGLSISPILQKVLQCKLTENESGSLIEKVLTSAIEKLITAYNQGGKSIAMNESYLLHIKTLWEHSKKESSEFKQCFEKLITNSNGSSYGIMSELCLEKLDFMEEA